MSAAENKQMIRNMFTALARGEAESFLGNFADDVRYTIIGTGKYSSTYNGKQDMVNRLLGPLSAQLEGGIELTPDNLIAEGEFVAMQAHGKARAKNGVDYNNTYCHVFRVVDGKIRELTEYLDTELVTRAFGK